MRWRSGRPATASRTWCRSSRGGSALSSCAAVAAGARLDERRALRADVTTTRQSHASIGPSPRYRRWCRIAVTNASWTASRPSSTLPVVALALDPLQYVARREEEKLGATFGGRALDLVPADGRCDRRPRQAAQRVRRHRLPARVVLEPVDVDLAGPRRASRLRDDEGIQRREPRSELSREPLRVGRLRKRRVHVQAERARGLRVRLEPELLQQRPERERDARRLDEPGGRAGIEVEDDLRRLARRLDAPE